MKDHSKNQPLMDEGENMAVRMFLLLYKGQQNVTGRQMQDHLKRSGFPYWPAWVETEAGSTEITKAGAQLWLRHLFNMELTLIDLLPVAEIRAFPNERVAIIEGRNESFSKLRVGDSLWVRPPPADKSCPGIPRKGCNYLAVCDTVCNKCGEVHTSAQVQNAFHFPEPKSTDCTVTLKPKFSPHEDAARLDGIARQMSYNRTEAEARQKHTLYEISMRLRTGGYIPRLPTSNQPPSPATPAPDSTPL